MREVIGIVFLLAIVVGGYMLLASNGGQFFRDSPAPTANAVAGLDQSK